MPLQQLNINRQAVHVRADVDEPKQLTVTGDKVYVGRNGSGPEDNFRVLEHEDTITFNHGLWFASAGSSKLSIVDPPLDQKVDITAPKSAAKDAKQAGVKKQRETGARRTVKDAEESKAKAIASEESSPARKDPLKDSRRQQPTDGPQGAKQAEKNAEKAKK